MMRIFRDEHSLPGRRWLACIGPFSFPDGTACTRRVWGIARSLAEAGERVVVGAVDSPSGPMIAEPPAAPGGMPVWYQGLGAFDSRWSAWRKVGSLAGAAARAARDWLERQPSRPRAVILYHPTAAFLAVLLPWCARHGVALIGDVVEWHHPRQVPGGAWTPLAWSADYAMRHLVPRCDGIIAISRFLEDYYTRRGCRVIRVPPTMDMLAVPRREEPPDDGRIALVYAGVPARKDLLANALEGLRRVDPEGKRFIFRLVGPEGRAVRRLCPKYPVEAVVCLGRQDHGRTLEIVAGSCFSVLLRPRERYANAGFPTKVVESLACGTPVICNLTSDLGDYIRDGREGIVCRGSGPGEFADALKAVLVIDRGRMAAMRKAARAQAERSFDYRNHASALGRFVDQTVECVARKNGDAAAR